MVFLVSLLVAGALFLHLFEDEFGVDLTAPISEYTKESIENAKKSAETGALAGASFIATVVGDIFAESLTMVSEWRMIPVFFLLMILLLTASVLGIVAGPVMVVIGVIALIASAVGYLAFETIEISFAKPLLSIAIGLVWSFVGLIVSGIILIPTVSFGDFLGELPLRGSARVKSCVSLIDVGIVGAALAITAMATVISAIYTVVT